MREFKLGERREVESYRSCKQLTTAYHLPKREERLEIKYERKDVTRDERRQLRPGVERPTRPREYQHEKSRTLDYDL